MENQSNSMPIYRCVGVLRGKSKEGKEFTIIHYLTPLESSSSVTGEGYAPATTYLDGLVSYDVVPNEFCSPVFGIKYGKPAITGMVHAVQPK